MQMIPQHQMGSPIINCKHISSEKMDLIKGMMSFVKDMRTSDREFRNLNFQLKYTLQRAHLLLKKFTTHDPHLAFMIDDLNRRVIEGQSISSRLDSLLNAESIAIQDKIRLSLPFNQTKAETTSAIESIEKAISDLKQQIATNDKSQSQSKPVKRVMPLSTVARSTEPAQSIRQQREAHNSEEEENEMGPTINDEQVVFVCKRQCHRIVFSLLVKGESKIIEMLENEYPDLVKMTKSLRLDEEVSNPLFTVARKNFQKCYSKIKKMTGNIDRISTLAHFHFVVQKIQGKHQQTQKQTQESSQTGEKRQSLTRTKSKLKQQGVVPIKSDEQAFFSFPEESSSDSLRSIKVLMKKEDSQKMVYHYQMGQWMKVEEQEIQVANGGKFATFVDPKTQQPTLFFQLSYFVEQS